MGERKGYFDAFGQLMSERRNVTGYIEGLRDQRDELNQEIRAKTAGPVLQSMQEAFEVVRLVPLSKDSVGYSPSDGVSHRFLRSVCGGLKGAATTSLPSSLQRQSI